MTDGQLNSFYNRSYREGAKAEHRYETSTNKKTMKNNLKKIRQQENNFNKAIREKHRRGILDKTGW